MCCKITKTRIIRLRKRDSVLTKLSTSIKRLQKHRKPPKEASIHLDRKSWHKKFNALMRMGKL